MTLFSSTDPKYQVSSDYPPDKEASWPGTAEQHGWYLAHNHIRGEMQALLGALQAVEKRGSQLQAWEVAIFQSTIVIHTNHIHLHHSGEDDVFAPAMAQRIHLGEKIEADHKVLVDKMQQVSQMFANMKEGDNAEPYIKVMKEYQAIMLPHLKEEEDYFLPLLRAYFTPEEFKPYIMKVIQDNTKYENGGFVYYQGEDFFRKTFMKHEQIPFFVWYIEFKPALKAFVKDFVEPLQAVKDNLKKPIAEKSLWDTYCVVS